MRKMSRRRHRFAHIFYRYGQQNVTQKAQICAHFRQIWAPKCHAEGTDLRTLSTDMDTLSHTKKDVCNLSRSSYRHTHTDTQLTYICVCNLTQQTNKCTLPRSTHSCTYTHMHQSYFFFFWFVSAGTVQEGDAGSADQL